MIYVGYQVIEIAEAEGSEVLPAVPLWFPWFILFAIPTMRLGISASFLIVIGFSIMQDILIVPSQYTEVAYNPNVPSTPLSAAMPSVGILFHVALGVSLHLVNVVKITSK